MSKELKSDPLLIKNPFTIKSCAGVRVGVGKDPRYNKVGNIDFVEEYKKPNGNIQLIDNRNNMLSYTCGSADETKNEYTSLDAYDYHVSAETLNKLRSDKKEVHKDGVPMSFLQITNEIDGIDWYRNHYPKLAEELLPVIARYHWGEPITKKAVKNERKKFNKKLDKEKNKIIRKSGNFVLDFN